MVTDEGCLHPRGIVSEGRACGHNHLNQFNRDDLATWKHHMALLSGVNYSGYSSTD